MTKVMHWYSEGRRDADRYGSLDAIYYEHPSRADQLETLMYDDVAAFAYAAGMEGLPAPQWVRGWRYGSVPASGRSTNYRELRAEAGVSIMALGQPEPGKDDTDGTFAMFNAGRPVVVVEGWLHFRRGSDGEPLLVGCREIA